MSPLSNVSSLFLPSEDYLPINECNSGPPILTPRVLPTSVRVVTIKSPVAPVSPGSVASSHHSGSVDRYYNLPGDETPTDEDVYNYPKPYNSRDSDIYKLPTSHGGDNYGRSRDSDVYKVPPMRNGTGHSFPYDQRSSGEGSRDSNYDYPPPLGGGSADRDSNYDYPPGAVPVVQDDDCVRPIWECESRTSVDLPGDTYDIIPPRSNSQQFSNGSNFSSLPPAPRPPTNLDDVYDIPGRSGSQMAPPKGHRMPSVHRYINAAPTPIRTQVRSQTRVSAADEGLYLPMTSGEGAGDVYLPMNQMDKLMNQFNSPGPAKRGVGTLPPPPPVPLGGRSSGEVPLKAPMTLPRSSGKYIVLYCIYEFM